MSALLSGPLLHRIPEEWPQSLLVDTCFVISSFGQDDRGELYVVDLNGQVDRIIAG